jgi:type II secretory pathway pseudopilin PulG
MALEVGVGMIARLRARLAQEDGMTLIELLWSLGILAFVLSGIIAVFISGLHSEFDMNQRFQAQQEARLALQTMRSDLRSACTAAVSSSSPPTVTKDIVVLGFCSNSTTTWSSTPVSYTTWCARNEGGTPVHYGLYRETASDPGPGGCATATTGIREADWLTQTGVLAGVFTCVPSATARPELGVSVPVDAYPKNSAGVYALSDTILLRNAATGAPCT